MWFLRNRELLSRSPSLHALRHLSVARSRQSVYIVPDSWLRSFGSDLLPRAPNTEIWGLLYARMAQIDGEDFRNVLLGRRRAVPQLAQTDERERVETVGFARWQQIEIDRQLKAAGLPRNAALTVLAVELLPEFERKPDPLGADLGHVRILRTSPLIPVPEICL